MTIAGYPWWQVAGFGIILLFAMAGAFAVVFRLVGDQRDHSGTDRDLEEFRDEDGTLPDTVTLEPPQLRGSRFGILGELWKTWRYLNKTEKLAGNGYVKWYLIDDTFPKPRFIKPEDDGTGMLRYEHDDGVYLFPRRAAKASAENGMWTFIHQRGDAEPLNIHNYRETTITAEEAEEWLTQTVSSERPSSGLLDLLPGDMEPEMLIGGAIAVAVVWAVISGGL